MTEWQGTQWFKVSVQVQTPQHSKSWSNVQLRLRLPIPLVNGTSGAEKRSMLLEAIQ